MKGKIVLIVGASGGIGSATAKKLGKEGAEVV
jgi:NAD(P)-dependent dehydrogenase (short-subunit alcohol dehydrogenase family)